MKKLIVIAASGLLVLSPASAADKVKIGFLSTLSGPLAVLGTEAQDGFNLALRENNNKVGGLPVEVLVGDDQASPDAGKQAADRMLKRDKVDFMTGVLFSNVLLTIAPSVFAAKVFYISSGAGPAALAGAQCNPFFFGIGWQNDGQSEAMGQYLKENGFKNVYLLAANYAGGKDNITGFKRTFDGGIVGESYVKLGALDFSSELAEIRATKGDALFFFLPGAMGTNFIKQYVAAGLDKQMPLFAPGYDADEDTIAGVGAPMIGLRNASHWAWDLDNPANKHFVEAFQSAYHRYPSVFSFQGYEAFNLIARAVSDVKGNLEDKDALRDAIKAARFASARGDFKFNTNQFPIQNYYLRVVQKDGTGTITNRTIGTIFKNHTDSYASLCPMK